MGLRLDYIRILLHFLPVIAQKLVLHLFLFKALQCFLKFLSQLIVSGLSLFEEFLSLFEEFLQLLVLLPEVVLLLLRLLQPRLVALFEGLPLALPQLHPAPLLPQLSLQRLVASPNCLQLLHQDTVSLLEILHFAPPLLSQLSVLFLQLTNLLLVCTLLDRCFKYCLLLSLSLKLFLYVIVLIV